MKTTHHEEQREITELGFWIYLMTVLMLFAALFATFWVLRDGVNGGPSGHDLFDTQYALVETILLLASSVACGISFISLKFGKVKQSLWLLGATIALGLGFLGMEINEFMQLIADGNGPNASAFLSGFFTLVGTHGLHIAIGLLWAIILLLTLLRRKADQHLLRKFGLFTLFWHFLDLVWIFIFSVVYLIGGAS